MGDPAKSFADDPYLPWSWHIAAALQDLADSPQMGGVSKIESIEMSEACMFSEPTYSSEQAQVILQTAVKNGLADPLMVTRFELNPSSVAPTVIKSLERKLSSQGRLEKSFHITVLSRSLCQPLPPCCPKAVLLWAG